MEPARTVLRHRPGVRGGRQAVAAAAVARAGLAVRQQPRGARQAETVQTKTKGGGQRLWSITERTGETRPTDYRRGHHPRASDIASDLI